MENWLKKAYEDAPDKTAVKYGQETITYKLLYEEARVLAGKIKSQGQTRSGRHIYNSLESLRLTQAVMQAQVQIVFINTRLSDHEISEQLADVGVSTVIATKPFEIDDFEVIAFEDLY